MAAMTGEYTKLFVSIEDSRVTAEDLRAAFEPFGELGEVAVKTGGGERSHFGFVWTRTKETAMAIMAQPHTIGEVTIPAPVLAKNRRRKGEPPPTAIDPRCASDKIFVGGLSNETTVEAYRAHFESFGAIKEAIIMNDRVTGRSRGFGFVTFENPASVSAVLAEQYHELDGRKVEVKPAMPKEMMPDEPGGSRGYSMGGVGMGYPANGVVQGLYGLPTAMGFMPPPMGPFGMWPGAIPPGMLPGMIPGTTMPYGVRVPSQPGSEPGGADELSGSMAAMRLMSPGAPAAASPAGPAQGMATASVGAMGFAPGMMGHACGSGGVNMAPMPGMPMAPHPVMMRGIPVGGPVSYPPGNPARPAFMPPGGKGGAGHQ